MLHPKWESPEQKTGTARVTLMYGEASAQGGGDRECDRAYRTVRFCTGNSAIRNEREHIRIRLLTP